MQRHLPLLYAPFEKYIIFYAIALRPILFALFDDLLDAMRTGDGSFATT
ncbi:MAG: hypothetical protein RAO75_05100 [Candidatus Chlorobium antarcticum]|nr:hypothetical protein [Candidatus Chlorobium antarcticum]